MLEIMLSDKKIQVDKFMSYGFDREFFAVVGGDLYYRTGNHYSLLKNNYLGSQNNV